MTLNLVLLGFDLSSAVRRGENAGKALRHDFVVLGSSSVSLAASSDGYRGVLAVPKASNTAQRYALAAWVSRGSDPTPLQAVGGWWPSAQP